MSWLSIVQHVRRAIDGDADFGDIREDVFFQVLGACDIGLYKKQEDPFHGPSLSVDFDVQPGIRVFCKGQDFVVQHMVISELFAGFIHSECLGSEKFSAYHFALELDVGQLVFQLGGVRASDHLCSRGKLDFENKVVKQGLRVENAVVRQDLVVEPDEVLASEYLVQLFSALASICCPWL